MIVNNNCLLELPKNIFCQLPTLDKKYLNYAYLVNKPIENTTPVLSDSKILIGNKGYIRYLNVSSYFLGYVLSTPKVQTYYNKYYILIGKTDYCEIKNIGEIKTIYCDDHLTVLHSKKQSSYLITFSYLGDIPQPIKL